MWGLSLVVASGGHSSSRCAGLSLSRPLLLRSTSSRRAGSIIVALGPSRSAACGIFPDQGSNPCPLHWQADSQPLRHQGSPVFNLIEFHTLPCFIYLLYSSFWLLYVIVTWGHRSLFPVFTVGSTAIINIFMHAALFFFLLTGGGCRFIGGTGIFDALFAQLPSKGMFTFSKSRQWNECICFPEFSTVQGIFKVDFLSSYQYNSTSGLFKLSFLIILVIFHI